jgi:hypothetical protein
MGAKIVLSGEAQNIHREGHVVIFTIDTGPATRHPPPGLELYDRTRYRIECTAEQWDRTRQDPDDRSALLVEGYLEPRQDAPTGQLYVAVVAITMQSTLAHNRRRLKRLQQSLDGTRLAFKQARDAGASQQELEARAAAFVQASETLDQFVERHPYLAPEGRD